MSRRKARKSMADKPVTRRYVARVVERARQDIIRAVVDAAALPEEHARPAAGRPPIAWPFAYDSASRPDA